MIPPPLAIPLAYAPLPLTGERLSPFLAASSVARIRPYTALPTATLCDTLGSDQRPYKRPIRQRKWGQWFPPPCYARQGNPPSRRKHPQRARRSFPLPATRPSSSNAPSAPIRSLPATGPPLPTGPPGSSATGPPHSKCGCRRANRVLSLLSAVPALPEPSRPAAPRPGLSRRRRSSPSTPGGAPHEFAPWKSAPEIRPTIPADSRPESP